MSRQIILGGKGSVKRVVVGGGSPISVQSMWKGSLLGADLEKIALELESLSLLGCDIMRFAVPDMESAKKLKELAKLTPIPLVADIHFDYRLALACMEGDIACVRINPGNIGATEKVAEVVKMAKATSTPMRIGVNSGSLPKDLLELPVEEALVLACEREMEIFESLGFLDYAISLKASSVEETVKANKLFASKHQVPIHLGITEAGPVLPGAIKTAIAMYRLLSDGIGDTIRVSLSGPCADEVIAGREILRTCGKSTSGVRLVSCPRCGRNGFDVHSFIKRWEKALYSLQKNVTIAVMGCAVNGPGEARNADIGITGSPDVAIIFKHGDIVKKIELKDINLTERERIIDEAFEKELASL